MIYLVVDKKDNELLFDMCPVYDKLIEMWYTIPDGVYSAFKSSENYEPSYTQYRPYINMGITLPKGSIERLIGKSLKFQDGPFCVDSVT